MAEFLKKGQKRRGEQRLQKRDSRVTSTGMKGESGDGEEKLLLPIETGSWAQVQSKESKQTQASVFRDPITSKETADIRQETTDRQTGGQQTADIRQETTDRQTGGQADRRDSRQQTG
jgi:hypothetical protein